jgi:diguanylate cyclase
MMEIVLPVVFGGVLTFATLTLVGELRRDRRDRTAWLLFTFGIGLWTIGAICRFLFFPDVKDRPFPAWIDPLFLAIYPFVFAALILVISTRLRRFKVLPWLDGLAGVLVMIALSLTFLHEPITERSGFDAFQTAVLLAYPLGDLILIVLTGFLLTATGFRRDGPWPSVAAGLLLFALADLLFVLIDPGKVAAESPLWALWTIGVMMIVHGARQGEPDVREITPGHRQLLLPLAFSSGAILVLIVGQWRDLLYPAVGFSIATLLVVLVRLCLSARENIRIFNTRESRLIDDLTGLPARGQVNTWLAGISASPAEKDRSMILLVNVNHFRELNAALGPTAGDLLLSGIASRLHRTIGRSGRLGRLGGDEFILITRFTGDPSQCEKLTAEAEAALKAPFSVFDLEVPIDCSFAAAIQTNGDCDGDDLLWRAQLAMREVKAEMDDELTNLVVYSEASQVSARDRLKTLSEFRLGLEREELVLHYQPKVRLEDRSVTRVEALVRWQHPDEGLLGPYRFLDIAEEAGLMHSMTSQIITLAIEQMAKWRDAGIGVGVAVNLAMPNLLDTALPSMVKGQIEAHEIPAEALTLEITEKIVMSDPDRVLGNLNRLSEIGFRVSLDDFGAENTSLAYLRRLPIDEVKLDRSLAGEMTASPADAAIVRASIQLAQDLGLHVVAEGVEDPVTIDVLSTLGCDEIQGYVFAKPMPADEFVAWDAAFALKA